MTIDEKLKAFFEGKKVVILGFGREGRSTLKLLGSCNCKSITVADMNPVPESEAEGCTLCCGEDYLTCLDDCDVIMKAPGVILKNIVSDEIKAKITSQTDLFLRFCDNMIIGITGTKGKSTTSSLIKFFIEKSGKDTMLIGNIGVPPLERREEFTKDCVIVCEMSCHQLEYVKASPDVAVLLNIYPEHLDHYTDFAAYRNAKLNIFRYQNENDTLIIGEEVKQYADTKARVITAGFSCGDIGTRNGGIFIGDEFYPADVIDTKLKGEHNLYNIAIAIYAATKAGCTVKQCLDALPQFNGLEHRLEYVCMLNGATSVRNLIILPDSGKRVAEKVTNPLVKLIYADDMEQAVKYAKQVTKTRCILSPAAASYGFYKNFEERGKHFKELVTSNN